MATTPDAPAESLRVSCQHCGQAHPEGVLKCPLTGLLGSAPGLIGKQLDRYRLERLLGVGGFGSVFRARHVHTDATVALKLLKRELGADPSMLDRFMREAKAASAVGSPHIVGVLDAGVTDGQAFLALEFLDGSDLKDLVNREGASDPLRLIQVVIQVLDGLAAAHAKGIVHRDMKPANVFVVRRDGRDFVKLLDFGISKMHQEGAPGGLTMTGVAMGTPTYMAPEQFFDARGVDGRSDLYSVAVMLYELLARRLPFEAQSYAELVVKVRTEVPPPLATVAPGVPAALCALVDKGLAREREHRWQTAQQMATALREVGGRGWTPERLKATPRPEAALPLADTPSMLHGKTAPPTKATPAPAAGNGWAIPEGNLPAPGGGGGPPPLSFGPVPAALLPLAAFGAASPVAAPAPLAVVPAKKGRRIWLWVVLGIGGALFACCFLSILINVAKNGGR